MVYFTHSMPRNNPRGVDRLSGQPDNQQERLVAAWISGFVDGEGCFSVSIIKNQTTRSGWQVFPEFVVTQGEKSRAALKLIRDYFDCGSIYRNTRRDNHKEHLLRYCVRSQRDLLERIIPFFEKFPLRTEKKDDFQKFKKVLVRMQHGDHLTEKGLQSIARVIQTMNRKVPSRLLESSETTRQNRPLGDKI
jgi:hypothetical protein